ncbi:TetR/AcrR family transcriptional regulator [Plantactinospora sp. B5E13]|uniref:TetR/AcrR family transcriptional regulator n=1 Tax=unclassified Plantactinospora TaxID=2631981 RepID=UPI00325D266F
MSRQRDLPEQQARLSAATWAVLAEQGLSGLTLRAVAERAGCTTGLVLHTFPDKRALLVHARELLHQRTAERADAAEAAGGPPSEVLRAVLLQAACLTPEKREEARVWLGFLAAALADPRLAELHAANNRSFCRRIARLVAASHPDWPLDHRDRVAKHLVALVEGLNTLAAVDPETYPAQLQQAAVDAAVGSLSRL